MAETTASTGSQRMPARIAFCITELDPGGAERAFVELATRLDRGRFSPVVYCLGPRPASNPTSLVDRLEATGVTVRCFGARRLHHLPGLAKHLVEQMRRDRPELVQTFLFHANVLGAWAARRAGVPCVVTGIRVAERRAKWHLWIARWSDRYVDRHVCVSTGARDFSREVGRLPAEKLLVIPNAVEVDRYALAVPADRKSLGAASDAKLIACIGRLDHQKGIDWLLEVMREVERREPKCELLLVGDGPERAALERQALRLGLARVRFLSFRRDVPEILAASDLVVLPSRWEGMPNVVLEAMAAGRAVVATDVEGVCELLAPNEAEQVVSPRDPQRFTEQIVRFLGDETLRHSLGATNQARAREHFSFAATVSAYERLYDELLGRA
jgi:glycosyltransferase involved in cell wall biosynthesis